MILQVISAIIVVVLIVLTIRSWRHPGIALGLIWCLYPLEQVLQQGNAFLLRYSWFINALVAGIAAAMALKNVFSGRFRGLQIPRALIIILFLYGLCVLSLAWCPNFEVSKTQLLTNAPYIIIFVLIAPLCISVPDELNRAIRVVLYLGLLILLGLYFSNTLNRFVVLAETSQGKITGNPLAVASFAGYVALAAVFTIYRAKTSKAVFVLHILITGLALMLMANSGSRGQMISVVLAAFIWLPITARIAAKKSSILAIVFSAVIAIGMIYAVTQSGNLQNRWRMESVELHTTGRFEMARLLLEICFQAGIGHWIFGLGSSASFHFVGFYPHVVIAEVLGEEGLVGLALFLGFVFVVYRDGYRYIRSAQIDKSTRVNVGLLMALFTFDFILTFKQGSLINASGFFGTGICFVWFLAVLKKQSRRSRVMFHPNMLANGRPFVNQANRT